MIVGDAPAGATAIDDLLRAPDVFRITIAVELEGPFGEILVAPHDPDLVATERRDRRGFGRQRGDVRGENEAGRVPGTVIGRRGPDHTHVAVRRVGGPELARAVLMNRDRVHHAYRRGAAQRQVDREAGHERKRLRSRRVTVLVELRQRA